MRRQPRNRCGNLPTKRCFLVTTDSSVSSPSGVTRQIIIAITLVALAMLIWKVVDVFVIAFGGMVFATMLRAMATPLAERTALSPRMSLLVVVIVLLVASGLMFWLFGRQAIQQFEQLREQLPAAAEKFQGWLSESRIGQNVVDSLRQAAEEGNPLSQAGLALGATIGGIGNIVLIMVVAVYFAADPPMYREGALRLLPPVRRPQVRMALNDAGTALRKWLLAQLIIMLVVGTLVGVGLALLGVPLALSLGLIAGLLEFIPIVGPIVAAIPGILLAFSVGPETALYVLIFYIGVQQIEGNVLTPLIQRWAVALPPVVAVLSIVVAGLLFGVLGVIFATPMAVVVMAMVKHLYVEDTLEKNRPKPHRAKLRPS
jgi:predicted PurR-regulated permease PerM